MVLLKEGPLIVLDSIQTNTVIKIRNNNSSRVLFFTVESVSEFGVGQVQLIISPGTINYTSSYDKGFFNNELIVFRASGFSIWFLIFSSLYSSSLSH